MNNQQITKDSQTKASTANNGYEFDLKKDEKETPTKDFIEIVKQKGEVWASTSHYQNYPDEISQYGILQWQYDGELFAITALGKRVRVVANKGMPAFHIYL